MPRGFRPGRGALIRTNQALLRGLDEANGVSIDEHSLPPLATSMPSPLEACLSFIRPTCRGNGPVSKDHPAAAYRGPNVIRVRATTSNSGLA